jgi:asparagine synthase (glutamine-hydrolysing)
MCGIAAIVAPQARRYAEAIERMVAALGHRGPDGHGFRWFENCALGHARLSIVDLHTGGQPICDASGHVAVVCNGEIYGYREIRRALADYPYRTASDTEVILALRQRYGGGFVAQLPGMFALALWDDATERLVCARDRFGEKPLYYAHADDGTLVLASELKALLASGLVRPKLSIAALRHYLQYLYVPPAHTIYENVHVLPPAHVLTYRRGEVRLDRYWELPPPHPDIDAHTAAGEFRRLLEQAVRRCLVADVPVAAFLSGGLDSSTIVALAARECPDLQTISFGFEGAQDETPMALAVAQRYRTPHAALSLPEIDLPDALLGMAEVYEEPLADSSCVPTHLIARLAREHAKVVLTGDGGDELLAGYAHWYRPLLARLDKGERSARALLAAHRRQKQYFSDDDLAALGLAPGAIPELDDRAVAAYAGGDALDAVLREDIATYLPGDILVKTDRAAMACGLELRSPFLDIDLASFCISLPSRLKINSHADKLILRQACEHLWPASVRRRGKQGFGAPVHEWLRRPELRPLKENYLNDQRRRLYSVLPFEATRPFIRRDDARTWVLLVLSLWMERWRA